MSKKGSAGGSKIPSRNFYPASDILFRYSLLDAFDTLTPVSTSFDLPTESLFLEPTSDILCVSTIWRTQFPRAHPTADTTILPMSKCSEIATEISTSGY